MGYNGDKTFDIWATEVGRNARSLRVVLTELGEQKQDWDEFKDGRTNTQIAMKLGRTAGTGTAQSGTATTVKLAAGDTQPDDFYNGMTVRITEGPGAGEEKPATDYDEATKDLTVDSAWTVTPTSASKYAIQKDINILEDAIRDGSKVKRIAFGSLAHTPASDLMPKQRAFT